MPRTSDQLFETLTTEGTLLPSDFLQRLAQHDREVPGLTADAYHLGSGERINEAISRSWNRLLAVWKSFTVSVAQLPETDPGDKLTREKWLLPFFQELGYGRLSTSKPFEFDGRRYAISHIWQNTPIHLFSFRADLDTRSENIIGARTSSPHSMVQEFLNRSEGHLWGIVCNGYRLRLLRDNASLTRQAYVEFDLQSMMQGEVYADFALLWLLLHQSRVEGERPELCWLEKWTQEARQRGARVLDQLRDGVEESITALGSGFLAHPANAALRDKLNTGALTKQDYFRQLLRIVYRFLFLFVAEDRELLFTEQVPVKIREQYLRHYSLTRLRRMALRLGGTQHADLWHVVRLVFQALGSEKGCPALGLPALGSFLWSDKATPDINDCQIANRELLQAIRALAFAEQKNVRRPIDYKNIGTEELGSVYESLLEQHPDVHVATAKFTLGTHAGHERKTTGSYYTPPSLVQCLLDSALEPVVAEACKKPNPEQAILALKVCDKACGSGHFLIAAAHRIARRLAAVRTGEDEPGPVALRHALRDVIGHCIYGVDINPMAVELCKFALWLEAVEPGKPLSFLDHHIQCGNSLIGATPALMQQGIPDKAFEPIEGDDRKYCAQFKKANKDEAEQMQLFSHDNRPWEHLGNLAVNVAQLASLPEDTVSDVQTKERRYADIVRSSSYESGRQLADAWCASFVWIKRKPASPDAKDGFDYPITNDIYRRLERNPRDCPTWMRDEIRRLANQYQFFHWHLAFPEVFHMPTNGTSENKLCGWNGGFDVILGNPPWVRQELLGRIKNLLSRFESFSGTADLSVFFLSVAIELCRKQGRIGLLTPNKWMKSGYGEALRGEIFKKARIILLVDFGHSRTLFPDADTFPAAIILENGVLSEQDVHYVRAFDADRANCPLSSLIATQAIKVPLKNLTAERWQLEKGSLGDLVSRLSKCGISLGRAVENQIYRGVLTGFNEAFVLSADARHGLVSACPNAQDIIKPWLTGANVKRWNVEWSGDFVVFARRGIDIQNYPAVLSHLQQYREALTPKKSTDDVGLGRKPGHYNWFEIQDNVAFYPLLNKPKIVVPCIAYYCEFAMEDGNLWPNNKVVFISTDDLYLLAVLNSRITWWLMARTMVKMKDDALSIDVRVVRELPIPNVTATEKEHIRQRVQALRKCVSEGADCRAIYRMECEINAYVEAAFGLTDDERKLMNESLPERDPLMVAERKAVASETVHVAH